MYCLDEILTRSKVKFCIDFSWARASLSRPTKPQTQILPQIKSIYRPKTQHTSYKSYPSKRFSMQATDFTKINMQLVIDLIILKEPRVLQHNSTSLSPKTFILFISLFGWIWRTLYVIPKLVLDRKISEIWVKD